MSLLRDDVSMVLCVSESDMVSGDILWEFKTANPNLSILNLGHLDEWYLDSSKTKKHYRVHIPHTLETRNAMFKTRDDAVGFVNDFITRYK
jgi:hypothetical protein